MIDAELSTFQLVLDGDSLLDVPFGFFVSESYFLCSHLRGALARAHLKASRLIPNVCVTPPWKPIVAICDCIVDHLSSLQPLCR